MDLLTAAVRQQDSNALIQIFNVQKINQQTLGINSNQLPQDLKVFDRLVDAYKDYAAAALGQNQLIRPCIMTLVELGQAFNYAFDAHWMIPLARHIFTYMVNLAFSDSSSLMDNIKLVCTPLDVLRSKMQDRQPFPNTRKAGILMALNLVFRCYLKLNQTRHLERILDYVFALVLNEGDGMLEQWYMKSERTTFYFYMGKFYLVQHNVLEAVSYLEKAWRLCLVSHHKNRRIIYIHLLVAKLCVGVYPTSQHYINAFSLQNIFGSLIYALKTGNMKLFLDTVDSEQNQRFLMRHHIYNLIKWRYQLQLYRNLFRRTYRIASSLTVSSSTGFDNETANGNGMMADDDENQRVPPRIMLADLHTGLLVSGDPLYHSNQFSSEEGMLMALVGRLIETGFMKGYVSKAGQCVVVSRKQAFPRLNQVIPRWVEREAWWKSRAGPYRSGRTTGVDDEDDE